MAVKIKMAINSACHHCLDSDKGEEVLLTIAFPWLMKMLTEFKKVNNILVLPTIVCLTLCGSPGTVDNILRTSASCKIAVLKMLPRKSYFPSISFKILKDSSVTLEKHAYNKFG